MVEPAVLGEGTVARLMSQFPDAGEDGALGEGGGCPGSEAEMGTLDVGDLGGEKGEGECEDEVAEYVGYRGEGVGMEAVGWDGGLDFFHSVLWGGGR